MGVVSEAPRLTSGESRAIARGSALSLLGAIVTAAVGVGLILFLARTTTPDVVGWFSVSQSWFLITMAVVALGTRSGLVYGVSRLRSTGSQQYLAPLLRFALVPVIAVSVIVAAVNWFLAGWLTTQLELAAPGFEWAWRAMGIMVGIAAVSEAINAAALGLGDIRPTIIGERLVRPALQFGFVAIAVAIGAQAWLAAAWALAYLPVLALGIWWLLRIWPTPSADPGPSPTGGQFWRFTGPRAVTTLVQILLQRVDIIILALLTGPVAAAIYTAATRFLVVAQVGNQALSTVLEPRLAYALAEQDHPRAAALYHRSSSWLVLLTWPVLLSALVFAVPILALFGPDYEAGTGVVLVLATTMLLASSAGLNDVVLLMSGRSSLGLINHIAALVVMITIDLALIPQWGLLGAAIGWAASILVKNAAAVWQVWRHERMAPWSQDSLISVGATVVAFLLVPAAATALLGLSLTTALIAIPLGVLVLLAILLPFRQRLGLSELVGGKP